MADGQIVRADRVRVVRDEEGRVRLLLSDSDGACTFAVLDTDAAEAVASQLYARAQGGSHTLPLIRAQS